MGTRNIKFKSVAILWGVDRTSSVVYQENIPLDDYYDTPHIWDSAEGVRSIRMRRLRGLLFGAKGDVLQEFENLYDAKGRRVPTD